MVRVPACLAVALLAHPCVAQDAVDDPLAAWQPFLGENGRAPTDDELPQLLPRLVELLGAPDPQLRDGVAYTLLARWILFDRVLDDAQLRDLATTCRKGLRAGIGETGTHSVLRRSFSAIVLSLLLAADNREPWLDREGFDALLADTLRYLADERDVRGFDERLGWLHSVAHTADVLKFAARSRHLVVTQQRAMLDAIAAKLAAVAEPLCAGEDERLARALLALCARDDFDRDAFGEWLSALVATRYEGTESERLARIENRKHVLVSLFTLLSLDKRQSASLTAARDALRRALGG